MRFTRWQHFHLTHFFFQCLIHINKAQLQITLTPELGGFLALPVVGRPYKKGLNGKILNNTWLCIFSSLNLEKLIPLGFLFFFFAYLRIPVSLPTFARLSLPSCTLAGAKLKPRLMLFSESKPDVVIKLWKSDYDRLQGCWIVITWWIVPSMSMRVIRLSKDVRGHAAFAWGGVVICAEGDAGVSAWRS